MIPTAEAYTIRACAAGLRARGASISTVNTLMELAHTISPLPLKVGTRVTRTTRPGEYVVYSLNHQSGRAELRRADNSEPMKRYTASVNQLRAVWEGQ